MSMAECSCFCFVLSLLRQKKKRIDYCGVFFTAKLLLNLEFVRYFFPAKVKLTHCYYPCQLHFYRHVFVFNKWYVYLYHDFSVQKAIDDVQVTANYDKPVGMFDGLIQTMVCGVGIHKLIRISRHDKPEWLISVNVLVKRLFLLFRIF